MKNKNQMISWCVCAIALSACSSHTNTTYIPASGNYQYQYEGTQLYPEGYEDVSSDSHPYREKAQVVVPETYNVGAYHSPTPHTNLDKEWVTTQNPQGYTIEIADGDKASEVAGALYHAPKNERMAQVRYQRNGKTYYKGLYGSYPNSEAAQEALKSLPENVRQNAGIKTWGNVQNNVAE